MRKQDFSINSNQFPNNGLLIPLNELSEIVGNEILTIGKRISSTQTNNKLISSYINAMFMTEIGEILILNKE
ncbi:MAG: hypothetical protein HXX09_10120 [Bacteroidetes bacterium]|nr:hypothetical protein [Bacteroidota bacterium]